MRGKVLWMIASCLVILSMVLAACAPKAPTEVTPSAPKETTPTAPKEVTPTVPKENIVPSVEVPKYGGVATITERLDIQSFDQIYTTSFWRVAQSIPYEYLLMGDWAVGPAGSNKTDWMVGSYAPENFMREVGAIAESWEIPDDQTMIFHIRQGIRWHNKPPVNGRELDANDVAFSIRYVYLNPEVPKPYNVTASAPAGEKLVSAEATDKWTVKVKVTKLVLRFFEDVAGAKGTHIIPHEVIEKYGSLKDWRNSLGTGPFMLTDYTPASSLVFVKNPDYWQKDPVGPGKGNQLPYLDGLKVLIMGDKSTVLAGFRTGKIDHIRDAVLRPSYEELEGILKTNPETKYKEDYGESNHIGTRITSTDPLAAPMVKSLRVRQALVMAVDHDALVRDLYGGRAIKRVIFFKADNPLYMNDDQLVEILQKEPFNLPPEKAQIAKKMYGYDPVEAKKILAEEGYPNGFETQTELEPSQVDEISIVKGYWEKIGVKLNLNVREAATWRAYVDKHQFPAMNVSGTLGLGTGPESFIGFGPSNPDPAIPRFVSNRYEITDPILNKLMQDVEAVYGNFEARGKLLQKIEAWIIYNAWATYLPSEFAYNIWQPWLKNYYGMSSVGFKGEGKWVYYAWYDQELKRKMGFK